MHPNNGCYKVFYHDSNEKIWGIEEAGFVNFYIIEGLTKSLVIDTGLGIGNAREFVESITEKELIIVNTHNHLDHNGANGAFGEVYMHKEEIDAEQSNISFEEKKKLIEEFIKSYKSNRFQFETDIITKWDDAEILSLNDGELIDLGEGKHVEVIHTNGHTRGSICLLYKRKKMLFVGDTANDGVLIGGMPGQYLSDHYESMLKLVKRENDIDTLFLGHGTKLSGFNRIYDIISAEEDIMNGIGEYEICTDTIWPSKLQYKKGYITVGFDLEHVYRDKN